MHAQQVGTFANGSLILRDRELWATVNKNLTTVVFSPGSSSLSRLDAIANTFELYRLRRAVLHYQTAVGTTTAGAIYLGVDYDADDLPRDMAGVAALTPVVRMPVWQEGLLAVDVTRAIKGPNMYCKGTADHPGMSKSFAVAIWNTATLDAVGELWIDYEIELIGPTSNQVATRSITYTSSIPLALVKTLLPTTFSAFRLFSVPRLNRYLSGIDNEMRLNPNVPETRIPYSSYSDWNAIGNVLCRLTFPIIRSLVYDVVVTFIRLPPQTSGLYRFRPDTTPRIDQSQPHFEGRKQEVVSGQTTIEDASLEPPTVETAAGATYGFRYQPEKDFAPGDLNFLIPLWYKGTDLPAGSGMLSFTIATFGAMVSPLTIRPLSTILDLNDTGFKVASLSLGD